jgi:hypothetical protein
VLSLKKNPPHTPRHATTEASLTTATHTMPSPDSISMQLLPPPHRCAHVQPDPHPLRCVAASKPARYSRILPLAPPLLFAFPPECPAPRHSRRGCAHAKPLGRLPISRAYALADTPVFTMCNSSKVVAGRCQAAPPSSGDSWPKSANPPL